MYLEDLMKSINFMESKLTEKITVDDVAKHIGYSTYHFIRLFQATILDTPWNYLRKRRLSEAALELKQKSSKVIDLAYKYQFESSEAFSRAFSTYFSISPTRCRESNDHIQLFLKERLTTSKLMEKRRISMQPEIKELPRMNLMGIVYYGKNENEEIASMWGKHYHKLTELDDAINPNITYGFCFHTEDYQDSGDFYYLISKEVPSLKEVPMALTGKTVPKAQYAIFHVGDVSRLGETYQYIFGEWLPKQKVKVDESFNMEVYEGDQVKIYIPILK